MSTIVKRCGHENQRRCACKWVLRYPDAGNGGKQKEESFPAGAKSEAKDRKLAVDAEWREYKQTGRSPVPPARFGDYMDRYITTRDLNPKTVRCYRALARHLQPLAGRQVADVTDDRAGVSALLNSLREEDNLAYGSVLAVQRFVTGIANEAVRDGIISTHRLRGIKVVRDDNYRIVTSGELEWVTPENVGRLRAALPGNLRLVPDLMAGCGLRVSEALGVRLADFTPDRGMLRVQRQVRTSAETGPLKHRRPGQFREVQVPRWVAERLEAHVCDYGSGGESGTLIRGLTQPHVEGTKFQRAWNKARIAAGIPGALTHDLRHHYASRLLSGGTDLAAVAKYLGHSDVTVTAKIYVHFLKYGSEPARDIMDRWLAA